jgi:hypothetical protein
VACVKDRKEILPDEGFSTSKIDLKDMMLFQLIDQAEALIECRFRLFSLSRSREAMNTRKVALVRYLPGHIDRSG